MGCCNDELAHCHGVLVRHADGECECIEDCEGGEPSHEWAVACAEVGCPCGTDHDDRTLDRRVRGGASTPRLAA